MAPARGPVGDALPELLARSPASWSVVARDAGTGTVLLDYHGDRVLDTASLGKLILLAFTGHELLGSPELGAVRLDRRSVAPVADSGLWQHLDIDELPVTDAARLVFACSDNLAANALLDHFGLERVRAFGRALGLARTELLDRVRDMRGPADPETLSRGPAAELCGLMLRIARDELVGAPLSRWLREGLALNMDLSMVPAPLGLDPLAHAWNEEHPSAANKTGTDRGVRADAGILRTASGELAYAAVANYDPADLADAEVIEVMHAIGRVILDERPRGPASVHTMSKQGPRAP